MQTKEISTIVDKCFKLYESTKDSNMTVFDELYNTLYGSSDSYMHYFPFSLYLQLTSNCNLRCKHCFFYDNTEKYSVKNNLSDKEIMEYVRYFVEKVNILRCTITGGEVFTSKFLFDIADYLKSNGIIVKLVTNGTLITEDSAKRLSKIFDSKYDIIQISLDGAKKETNDSVRGKGVYDKVLNSLKLLKDFNINTEITFTVNSLNVSEIPDIYKLAKEYKVKRLNIARMSLESEEQKYLIPRIEDIFTYISKLYDIYDKTVDLRLACLKIPDFLNFEEGASILDSKLEKEIKSPKSLSCKPHGEQVTLFANGDISLCYDCTIKDVIIGNIKTDSFENIWKNRFSYPIFNKREVKNHACKSCKYLPLCLGGCPYRALEKYGSIDFTGIECSYFDRLRGKNAK